jgi:hypothetical protein
MKQRAFFIGYGKHRLNILHFVNLKKLNADPFHH